jgi:cytidine deaminase
MPEDSNHKEPMDPFEIQQGPELVFGRIGPLGVDLDQITQSLRDELKRVGYESTVIRLSGLLSQVKGLKS